MHSVHDLTAYLIYQFATSVSAFTTMCVNLCQPVYSYSVVMCASVLGVYHSTIWHTCTHPVDNLCITNVPCGTLKEALCITCVCLVYNLCIGCVYPVAILWGTCAKPVDKKVHGGGQKFPRVLSVPSGIQKRGKMGLTTVSLCIPVTHWFT